MGRLKPRHLLPQLEKRPDIYYGDYNKVSCYNTFHLSADAWERERPARHDTKVVPSGTLALPGDRDVRQTIIKVHGGKTMKESRKKKLEAAGFKITTVFEFLGLTLEEETYIEIKLALSK